MTERSVPEDSTTEQLASLQQEFLTMQESLMHLQHDQQQMHEVLSAEETPTLEDEKPPHY